MRQIKITLIALVFWFTGMAQTTNIQLSFSAIDSATQPGTLDPSFNGTGYVIGDLGNDMYHYGSLVQPLPDGKMVVAGWCYDTTMLTTTSQTFFIRYNHDGTRDMDFGYGGITLTDTLFHDRLFDIALQADGKIVGCGISRKVGEPYKFLMIRINSDGTFDDTFGENGIIHETGTGVSDWLYALAVRPDGKMVVRGSAKASTTVDQPLLVGYMPNGSRDTTFGSDGMLITSIPGCTSVSNQGLILKPDGKILTGGTIYINSKACVGLFQYNEDGTPDPAFGTGGIAIDSSILSAKPLTLGLQSSGKIVVPLRAYPVSTSKYYYSIFMYNPDGSPDLTFHGNGRYIGDEGWAYDICVQPDDKFIICGNLFNDTTVKHMVVCRYLPSGEPDPDFGENGIAGFGTLDVPSNCLAVALASNGQIVGTGYGNEALSPHAWREAVTLRLNAYGVGIWEKPAVTTIKANPNPFENYLTIETPGIKGSVIDVFSIQGQKVESLKMTGERERFTLGHLPEGLYLLRSSGSNPAEAIQVIRIK